MNLTGKCVAEKYRIIEFLGEGGTSFVYKAKDLQKGSFVALKVMKEKVTTSYIDDIIRFKREIDIVSKLNHPNIIRVFDAGEYNNTPFLVTELLKGESLNEYLKKNKELKIETIMLIMKQLTQALVYIHGKSIIHRDLKPGNIFLENTEEEVNVKLLDFGVSHVMELEGMGREDEVVGTFGYMSPEATGMLNRRIDERSDLYSLGVIFYTLLSGEPPFKGENINKILHQQLAYQPPELYKLRSNVSHAINNVVMKLIEKDPDLRYQSAQGLIYDINEIIRGNESFTPGINDSKIKLSYNTRIVGRDKEIDIMKKLFQMASQGSGRVLLIGGEAGIGKSALMDEISRYIYENNGVILKARCVEQQNKTPYHLFRILLDQYINYIEKMDAGAFENEVKRLNRIAGDFGEIYVDLNPSIGKYLNNIKKVMTLEPERENRRLVMALAELLLKLPDDRRVMVYFLDDLHWADKASLNLINEILRGIDSEKLLIVGTYRNNEIGPEHEITALKAEAESASLPLEEIGISSLDMEKLKSLISGLLGEKEENIEELAAFIFNRTGGNPLFSINLLRELVEKGAVKRNNGLWELDSDIIQRIPISGNILELILGRVDKLEKDKLEVICKAAVIGREVEISLLNKLAGIELIELIRLIDYFIELQLVERTNDKGKIIFVHDRIREVFYKKLGHNERKRIHLKLAEVIEEQACEQMDDSILFRLVNHYIEAEEDEKILKYVIPAARRAKFSYANEEAVRYYTIGINLLEKINADEVKTWIDSSLELIDVYILMGKNNEAVEMITKVLPYISQPLEKAIVYRKMGIAHFKIGDWAGCERNLSMGLKLLGERLPAKKNEWLFRLIKEFVSHILYILFSGNNGHEASKPCREEDKEIIRAYLTLNWMYILSDIDKLLCNILRMLNLSEKRLAGTEELGSSISAYASALMTVPLFRTAQRYHLRAQRLREKIGDEWGVAQSLQFFGFNYSWKGMHTESINSFERAREKFSKIGDMWELGMVFSGLGYGYRYTSQYKRSLDFNYRYLDLSRKINNTYGVISGYIELSYCYVENGSFDTASENIEKAFEACEGYNNQYLFCCALICKGYMELEKNNFENSVKLLEEARRISRENSFIKDYTVNLYPYLAEAYLGKAFVDNTSNRKDTQLKLKALCRDAIRQTRFWPNHYAAALRCKGKFLVMAGKTEKGKKYLNASIAHAKKIDRKYEMAKGFYELGIVYSSEKKPEESWNAFNTAYKIFKEIEAKEYLKRCTANIGHRESMDGQSSISTLTRLNAERRLSTILIASRYLSSILEMDELLEKIMDCVLEHVGAQRGALFLYPEEGGKLEANVVRNVSREEIHSEEFQGSRSIIKRVEMEKVPIIVSDALADESLNTESSIVINKIRSVMCAPIISKGEMIGIIYLDNSLIGGLFSAEDLKVLDLIACQAGVSVQNARLYKKLKLYSKEIEKSRDEIKMWNNTLEQKVAERTEQLEVLNQKYKNLADELKEKNAELNEMIEKLKEHAQTVEELAVTKERNRFAMDVHDTLGHSMVLLIKLLEVCKMELKVNPEKAEKKLVDAINTARGGMKELKRSIYGLVPEKLEVNKFITALKELVEDFKMSGTNIDLKIDGIYDYRNPVYSYTLFKICQEAMTNSVRHGKARNILIEIRFVDGKIKLYISDDGMGCQTIKKGFGLTGIEDRVKELNGSVFFSSVENEGFKLELELPLEV